MSPGFRRPLGNSRILARLSLYLLETGTLRFSVAECFLAYAFGLPFCSNSCRENKATSSGESGYLKVHRGVASFFAGTCPTLF